jgi:type I restriction enzyme S subunit
MLPQGWADATVDDLGEYLNGMAFRPEDWGPHGVPIIRIQNLTDSEKPLNRTTRIFDERYRVQTGDLLVSWSATLDAFIWDREEAVLNQHIFKVVPAACVDFRFLFYQLRRLIAEMAASEHLHGSTMRHINRGPFLAHPAVLPPLTEQRRIVAKLVYRL